MFVALLLAFWGAWNVDMARQTIVIAWLGWTGGLWKLRGRVERRMVYSPALRQERQVLVYLPPGYDTPANAGRRYPVLYLLHGFPDPGDGWQRFGLAPQLIDQNIVQGHLPPMLLMLPDCHNSVLGKFGDGEYLDAPAGAGRPGTKIATFVCDDVVKWADSHYRTLPSPRARLLAGLSTGAYGAVNLGLQRPDRFGILIALSGYYEADLKHFGRDLWGPVPDPKRLRQESPLIYLADSAALGSRSSPHPARLGSPPSPAAGEGSGLRAPLSRRGGGAGGGGSWRDTFVFIGDGYKDYADVRQESEQLDAALTKAGIAHVHHRIYGHHSWDMWRAMLVDGLRTVAPRIDTGTAAASPAPPFHSPPASGKTP